MYVDISTIRALLFNLSKWPLVVRPLQAKMTVKIWPVTENSMSILISQY